MKQEKIWDYFQNENKQSFDASLPRLQYLVNQCVGGDFQKKVLNIGVGGGVFEIIALQRGLEVYSLDPNVNTIASIQESLNMGDHAKVGYSQDIPFPDKFFDVVVVSEVLEHLSDKIIDKTLLEINRVLVEGGVMIGTVPANENLLENEVICPDCGKKFHRWGHVQSFSREVFANRVSQFFIMEALVARHFPYYLNASFLSKIKLFIKDIAWRLRITTVGESFYFYCIKKNI